MTPTTPDVEHSTLTVGQIRHAIATLPDSAPVFMTIDFPNGNLADGWCTWMETDHSADHHLGEAFAPHLWLHGERDPGEASA